MKTTTTTKEHEQQIGELDGDNAGCLGIGLAAVCFAAGFCLGWTERAWRWLLWKRVCAWHQPKPVRMGGNPLAWRRTDGLCADCRARVYNNTKGRNNNGSNQYTRKENDE